MSMLSTDQVKKDKEPTAADKYYNLDHLRSDLKLEIKDLELK